MGLALSFAPSSRSLSGEDGGGSVQHFLNADARDTTAANGKVSQTINEAASTLVRGEPGWSAALGVGTTVTYAYRASASTMPEDATGFERFNSAQITQAELALKAWSDVADITFTRVGSGTSGELAYSNNATILFGDYTSGVDGASAFAMFPGNRTVSSSSGDVWVNSTVSSNISPTVGNYGGQVLIHELGHAIGLAHPSEYDAGANQTITYSANADYYEDSRQYTVMSYFGESNTGASFGGVYSAAPLLDDIAAAQLEYGANTTTRTGDTVYGFNSNADRPWFIASSATTKLVFAVWDAGGRDTFDFSGFSGSQTIDLRAGNFSSVGGLTGNVAIGQGVTIEAAIGGSGADLIYANNAGDTVNGGAGADSILAGTGSNYLRGDDGNDSIQGSTGFDDINGNKGEDIAYGASGDDWVVGGQGNDRLYGEAGGDVVWGNLGNDTLEGGDGADQVRGGQGNDTLSGGAGDDYVSGDRGDDTETGGAGADIFHSFSGAGVDRVLDFSQAEGDRVMLDPGTVYTLTQSGADAIVDMGAGDQMILVNVQLSSLQPGWIFLG